jgi:hypothetical protein
MHIVVITSSPASSNGHGVCVCLATADVVQPENPLLTQLNEQWAAVRESDDFSTWTHLLSAAEKLVSTLFFDCSPTARLACMHAQFLLVLERRGFANIWAAIRETAISGGR